MEIDEIIKYREKHKSCNWCKYKIPTKYILKDSDFSNICGYGCKARESGQLPIFLFGNHCIFYEQNYRLLR